MDHEKLWEAFSQVMLEHIREKGKKYDKYGTGDAMSQEYWICAIRKYTDELMAVILGDRLAKGFNYGENLLSIAHIAAILYEKLLGPIYSTYVESPPHRIS
jgi:hypothetical protein